ncbi:copper homeostasis protein cutC homolog [Dendronephthya gigantea]|nr:copper homeostasis protein cutC homolog [Dendronephthya gigantea]XP_028413555.1 copper homeostasis protein cutC homolog [Dendronephthya gigantea]XP_028413556.1 copper homeostasis protein cutC homolog [Dendronephthya gigantea]XP_028413557.1 copper homeostasis protein cutC homolog [Dendronephthya gigantea]
MIRPRGGDFLYSDAEFEVMIEDCKELIKAGADGVVFGILTKKGEVDIPRCQTLLDIIKPLSATFHRAFDMVYDQRSSLEVIINLGFDRILTSGGKSSVLEGASRLKSLVIQAATRIIIMPGGGINEDNLLGILQETGAREFHGSARTNVPSKMEYHNTSVSMGGIGDEYGLQVANLDRIKHLTSKAQTCTSND